MILTIDDCTVQNKANKDMLIIIFAESLQA